MSTIGKYPYFGHIECIRYFTVFHNCLFTQILDDFQLLFEEVDDMALISAWPDIQEKLKNVHKGTLVCSLVKEMLMDSDVFSFLCFLKTIPSHKYKFNGSVNAFIVASDVGQIYHS